MSACNYKLTFVPCCRHWAFAMVIHRLLYAPPSFELGSNSSSNSSSNSTELALVSHDPSSNSSDQQIAPVSTVSSVQPSTGDRQFIAETPVTRRLAFQVYRWIMYPYCTLGFRHQLHRYVDAVTAVVSPVNGLEILW